MNRIILRSTIKGTIFAPSSKSVTHRAMIVASLAHGTSTIHNILRSDDTDYTIEACRKMGVSIEEMNGTLTIVGTNGKLRAPKKEIFLGNSGSTMRMMTAVASLSDGKITLTGEKRLLERPMQDLTDAMIQMGISVKSLAHNGCAPIEISGGTLEGGTVHVSGTISSQYITALLLISPFSKHQVTIIVEDSLRSKPYVAVTLQVMNDFGISVENREFQTFLVPAPSSYKAREYTIEGDYSSASYLFAAAAVTNGSVAVTNLNTNSAQGDAYILAILEKMGCSVLRESHAITVSRNGSSLHGIDIDMSDYPDLVPTICAVASVAKGKTHIRNIAHLKHKETNRIDAPVLQLQKMGIKAYASSDSIMIEGGMAHGASIATYNDHRMAMSFAVLGLATDGQTVIQNAEIVSKSYPHFFDDLEKIGSNIKIN